MDWYSNGDGGRPNQTQVHGRTHEHPGGEAGHGEEMEIEQGCEPAKFVLGSNYMTLFGFMLSLTGGGLIITSFQLDCVCNADYRVAGITVSCMGVALIIGGRVLYMKYSRMKNRGRRIITVQQQRCAAQRGAGPAGRNSQTQAWDGPQSQLTQGDLPGQRPHIPVVPMVPTTAPAYTSRPDLRTTFPAYPGTLNQDKPPEYSEAIKTYY